MSKKATDFKSRQEVYDFVLEVARHARSVGDDAVARALENGLQAGMTASEQLGGVRAALTQVRDSLDEEGYPESWGPTADKVIRGIDRAFRRANRGFWVPWDR